MTDKNTTVIIKPLSQSDFDAWLALWKAYLDFYETELPLKVSETTWQKMLNINESLYGFGAYLNNQLIGFAHTVLHPNTWNTTECCYLEDLYVDGALRGSGVGRALIEHVYQFADEKNCNRVYWVTDEDNKAAQRLYDTIAQKTDVVQYRHNL